MIPNSPPDNLNAEWIWTSDPTDVVEGYAFFRREFMLEEIPGSAELWITGHTTYHVYVNGRHFVRGGSPSQDGLSGLSCHDAVYLLQVGKNSISILVHNTQVSRFTHRKKRSGLLCQLFLDDEPGLWTDDSWSALPGHCYVPNQPRLSRAEGFAETVDLRRYPHGWYDLDYDAREWEQARIVQPVGIRHEFRLLPRYDMVSEVFAYVNYYVLGAATQVAATTHVSIPNAIRNPNGLYAAETYVHVQEDSNVRFLLFCDDPYYLFVNGVIIKSQGNRDPVNWTDPRWNAPRCYLQDQIAEMSVTVPLATGSTHFLLLQQVSERSSGATLVFPDTDREVMRFLRGADGFSFDGWNVLGELKIPFSHVGKSLDVSGLPKMSYYGYGPCDAAAHLMSYAYTAREVWEDPLDVLELQEGDYTVLELERYVRGCPEFAIKGSSGDIVDVLYGEYLNGHFVLPYSHDSRRVYTLILDEGARRWQAVSPQGMKYLMILVRQSRDGVAIQHVGVRKMTCNFRNATSFSCSDELFNQIWETGLVTLDSCFDTTMLNSGCSTEGQLLGDAMIQSLASLFIFGSADASEKALRDFALAQYETGEMPAIAPSDYVVRLHDFGLLWPVWLQRHVLHSGNTDLLEEMLPNLRQLLKYFESITTEDGLLLGNLSAPFELPCLIDYASSVDRRGVSTSLNALYYNCLMKCQWLFETAGNHDEGQKCLKRASQIGKAIRNLCWDSRENLFADAWYDGKLSDQYSMQANILALYSGIAPEKKYAAMSEKLFLEYAPFLTRIEDMANDNPYFKYFVLEMAFMMKNRDWAADFMRYYWGKMIADGATTWWDRYCPDQEFGPENALSLCHGYGVSPNYFLITEITGIRPVSSGYTSVYFNPLLTAVEWCRAQISTPHGTIQVDWGFRENGELEILIDSTYELEVVPLLNPDIISDAIMHVSDEVVIAYPEEKREEVANVTTKPSKSRRPPPTQEIPPVKPPVDEDRQMPDEDDVPELAPEEDVADEPETVSDDPEPQ